MKDVCSPLLLCPIETSMFSNDQNIESIGQLVETIKHYVGLQSEYVRLDIVEKTVRILTVIAITAILCMLLTLSLIYMSFAVAYALVPFVGSVAAFAIVAGVYFLILLLVVVFRKQWIEKPLVKFLASLLLSK